MYKPLELGFFNKIGYHTFFTTSINCNFSGFTTSAFVFQYKFISFTFTTVRGHEGVLTDRTPTVHTAMP